MIKYSAFFKRLSAASSVEEKLGETVQRVLEEPVFSVLNAKSRLFANKMHQLLNSLILKLSIALFVARKTPKD